MGLIREDFVSSSKYKIKCPYEMKPVGVCVHNTYNDASAKNEISYMKNNNNQVSYHVAVDNIEAIQAIPFNRNAWAAGDGGSGVGNRKYIHVEICYSKSGGSQFTNAEKRAARVVAEICKQYGWGVDKVKAHRDFAKKDCPHRTNMDEFKKLVSKELENGSSSNADNKVNVKVDGKQYEFDAIIKSDTTYVKLRSFEQAGYKVDYVNGVATIDKP